MSDQNLPDHEDRPVPPVGPSDPFPEEEDQQ